jgi:Tfp pilus assembly protein PilF
MTQRRLRFASTLILLCLTGRLFGWQSNLKKTDSPLLRGYVLFPDRDQRKAGGVEVRLVQGFPEKVVLSVKTEDFGQFAFPQSLPITLGLQIPGAPDTYYFYIHIDGYAPVMQIVKPGLQIIALSRGPSDPNVLPTEYDAPPLTRLEALRGELVANYSEPAVREYEAGLRDSLKHKEDSAVTHYAKAVRTAPEFFDAYLQLGHSQKELKHPDEAEKAFRHAVEIRPASGQALLALGTSLLDRAASGNAGVYEEAAQVLQQAAAHIPWSSQALYLWGSALYKRERFGESEAALRGALAQDPPNEEARLMLVNVFMKQHLYGEALDQLSAYLRAVPNTPQRDAVEKLQRQIQDALANTPVVIVELVQDVDVVLFSDPVQERGKLYVGDLDATPFSLKAGQRFEMVEPLGEGSCRIRFEGRDYRIVSCPWLDGFTDHQTDVFHVVPGG